jgi:hypothetical protein
VDQISIDNPPKTSAAKGNQKNKASILSFLVFHIFKTLGIKVPVKRSAATEANTSAIITQIQKHDANKFIAIAQRTKCIIFHK